jgi:hypothetical protein
VPPATSVELTAWEDTNRLLATWSSASSL